MRRNNSHLQQDDISSERSFPNSADSHGILIPSVANAEGEVTENPENEVTAVDRAAIVSVFLGHALFNMIMPPTVLATLAIHNPDAAKAVFNSVKENLLGEHAAALMPLMGLALSSLATFVELKVRKANGSSPDKEKVHTPFPGVRPFTIQEATVGVTLLVLAQIVDGALAQQSPISKAGQEMGVLYNDPTFAFLGQITLMVLATMALNKAMVLATMVRNNAPAWCDSIQALIRSKLDNGAPDSSRLTSTPGYGTGEAPRAAADTDSADNNEHDEYRVAMNI